MEKKLLQYGFQDWQVEKLLKSKKLNTAHGIYKLDNSKLMLKQDGSTKQINL